MMKDKYPIESLTEATIEEIQAVEPDQIVGYVFTATGGVQYWIPAKVIANDTRAGRLVVEKHSDGSRDYDWFLYGDGSDSIAIISRPISDAPTYEGPLNDREMQTLRTGGLIPHPYPPLSDRWIVADGERLPRVLTEGVWIDAEAGSVYEVPPTSDRIAV